MVTTTLAFLALSASLAVARPQYHSHFHHHHSGTGNWGTGWPQPTETQGAFNESDSGLNPTSAVAMTYSTADASVVLTTHVEPTNAAVADTDSTSCTTYSTSTEYATSVYYVTVTAGSSEAVAEASSTTAVYSSAMATSESTAAIVLASSTAAAAAFYGYSHDGNGYSPKASSTTFAVVTTKPAATTPIAYTSAASSAMTSAAATSASGGSSGGSSSSKKGLSYNSPSILSLFSGSGASWSYNWGYSAGGSMPSGIEFVPMCWGSGAAAGCASAVTSSGASHMLSFNEPDLGAQSNLDPATAAKLHIENIATPLSGKVKIGSPAVTSSESAGQGLSWMSSFLSDCGGKCAIDFMAIHWYGSADQLDMFKTHVTQAISLASQNGIGKVWITEFAVTGAMADQATFAAAACSWLDTQGAVERYAYFMAGSAGDLGMVTGNALNAVGLAYDA